MNLLLRPQSTIKKSLKTINIKTVYGAISKSSFPIFMAPRGDFIDASLDNSMQKISRWWWNFFSLRGCRAKISIFNFLWKFFLFKKSTAKITLLSSDKLHASFSSFLHKLEVVNRIFTVDGASTRCPDLCHELLNNNSNHKFSFDGQRNDTT